MHTPACRQGEDEALPGNYLILKLTFFDKSRGQVEKEIVSDQRKRRSPF
jgi:hypothetical protein